MSEQFANIASTTLASSYTAGSGSLSLTSAIGFPISGTFTLTLRDPTSKAVLLIYRVTSVSGTTFSGSAESSDTNVSGGALVDGTVLSVDALAQIKLDWGIAPYNFTDPTLPSYSWRSQGSSTVNNRGKSVFLWQPANSSNNIAGREVSVPGSTPYTYTVACIPLITNQNFQGVGIYLTDGTKLITFAFGAAGANTLSVASWNSSSSFNSTLTNPNVGYWPGIAWLQVINDGTNLTWNLGVNGTDWMTIYQAAIGSFLSTITKFGFFVNPANSSFGAGISILSFVQT
jgi:hypothetical protein